MYLSLRLLVLALSTSLVLSQCQNGARLIRRSKLSCGNKQYIIDYHNKIRNYVASGQIESQPKAANMIELRWNESLAKLAQQRADTCIFEHGDLDLDGQRVGQNLAVVLSTADNLRLNITYMMDIWYNEVFEYGYKEGFEPKSGHYSQLIWGNTKEVGCGYSYYKDDWYTMYFVCDYFPPGNWIGEKPYVYGKHSCGKYGLQDSHRHSKLCAIDNKDVKVCKKEGSTEQLYASNVTSAESNEINVDDKLGDENGNGTSSSESIPEEMTLLNKEDEVVSADYDESNGSDNSANREKVTDQLPKSNETATPLCPKENGEVDSKTIKDLELIYLKIMTLKYAFSENVNSSDVNSAYDSASNDTTSTDEPPYDNIGQDESENTLGIANNSTLEIVNETLEIASRLLETFKTMKN